MLDLINNLLTEASFYMYDYLIVTHIPNFYKVNLYNELAKKFKIMVIFSANDTKEKRADDFITLANSKFEYKLLHEGEYENRNVYKNILSLKSIFRDHEYKHMLVSGWDTGEDWFSIIANSKSKNCLALESTINDSDYTGIKGLMKRLFLTRISKTFASGSLHKNLLKKLKYRGEIIITKGVGIINKPTVYMIKREYKKRFLFIGRLSKEKNIEILVDIFNSLENFKLTIIGTGPLEDYLRNKACKNITFIGKVKNENLQNYFQKHDIIILPSISETWGLVVEEALYYGMPVIVSNNCGVTELIEEAKNGYIFDLRNPESLEKIILNINDNTFNTLTKNISAHCICDKDLHQVNSYDIK